MAISGFLRGGAGFGNRLLMIRRVGRCEKLFWRGHGAF